MTNKLLYFLIPLILILLSCGIESGYETYNITSIPELKLTKKNHPHGYGRENCFYCHVKRNIHGIDRINSNQIENARIITNTLGIYGCYQCHGENGVTR